ncbi:MAG: recombinase family protein [Alphaproteobacteria bacterium]|nr:recombinase family protein [Alphaproteobacteria bacterium]
MTFSDDKSAPSVGTARIPAAEYVRMSTENQKYSTENQAKAIRQYAETHNFKIVRTYADEGKSGLRIQGRSALLQLIDDVESGVADFKVILVYDVSRWGRFQDADESAYYEYKCRDAGIEVAYCAEQFTNDGSPVATIVKGVKRAMAGEYSRELSAKVFAGQCRLIEMGFRQGGMAGFGLRRMRVNQNGEPQGVLDIGEHKSLQTDRVILVPGPDEEVETVRWMYREFIDGGKQESEIAATLNERGVTTDLSRPWTRGTVHQVLSNEKYIGNNVYNRQSFKLKKRRVANSPDMWIRADGTFEGIVDPQDFYTAQGMIRERNRRYSDKEMLERLKQLFQLHGYLSGIIIDEAESMPSSGSYQSRFGSLIRAYELIGFKPDRDYRYIEINRLLRQMHHDIVAETIIAIETLGGGVRRDAVTDLLTVNGEFTASIVVARCQQTPAGSLRWKIRLDTGLAPDITVAVRMDDANAAPLDYYLLPQNDMTEDRLRLAPENGLMLDAYRFDTLEYFHTMAARAKISEIAV